jgi:hypothetical protein
MANYCGVPDAVRDLWPTPALGDWAVRDVSRTAPVAGKDGFGEEENNLEQRVVAKDKWKDTGIGDPVDPSVSAGLDHNRAIRGIDTQLDRPYQTYNKVVGPVVTRSLGRETLYNWQDAQYNVGGVGYPLDYGFGPGYHGDATIDQGNVQLYMKPGIYRRRS